MHEKVFNRVEKKYLLTKDQKNQIIKVIKNNLEKDKYYSSEVYNIYFDNDNFDLITQSVDWTDFKEKIRIRSYNRYNRVFIEIKTKIRETEENIGYKRRFMITREDYDDFVNHKKSAESLLKKTIENKNDIQIAKEVDYLINHFKLKPKILVIYNRKSFRNEEGLRITFDENLKYRDKKLNFKKSKHDKIYFKGDRNIIMEIKSQSALPLWLVKIMSEQKIYPEQFSKIGRIYEKIIKERKANV